MSKGRYHSVECKGVDWKVLSERVAGEGVVFAVDVAKHDFVGLLSRHWPEVLTVLEPASLTLHHLIAAFGGPQQVTILASQARALMQRVGRAGLGEEKIEAVLGSAADTLGVPCVLEERELLR